MNLVIVESPHKAETIQKFLGDGYKVVSSKGHIRDLQEKSLSVDIENNFTPEYTIPAEKKKTVAELKALASKADMVWLASDEDREGEAISWHIVETLGLDPSRTKRITFHEITKPAILDAIKNPRGIDMNLVDAQQARRVLDRLVGFELSPLLWRKIKRGLSAGRVQSVALRLIVDREKEIMAFAPEAYYKVDALFPEGSAKIRGTLDARFVGRDQALKFLEDSIGAKYTVAGIESREGTRTPAAPFTTSTLQQEAGRKLHFPVNTTMRIAQSLYERGLITYMRTDSTNLSTLALGTAKKFIVENFGEEYSHTRNYKTKAKGAQEAHEAIRPTFIGNPEIDGTPQEQKLYSLIWKRTVASQMAEARLLNTSVDVEQSKRSEHYKLQASEILFDGFLKVYMESGDDEDEDGLSGRMPALKTGQELHVSEVTAICKYTQAPSRYTQPSLVKKLEELGIGRPSTYGTIISTLTSGRGYVIEGDKAGVLQEVTNYTLKGDDIQPSTKTEMVGADKKKLLPTEIGVMVTDYLVDKFEDILDYGFTADVEGSFDKIAEGRLPWQGVIGDFYTPFHGKVDAAAGDRTYRKVEFEIGVDPADGKKLVGRMGPYGAYIQKGDASEKMFANVPNGMLLESITLESALKLFQLPRTVGQYEGTPVIATKGRFGAYLKFGDSNVSLPRGTDPVTVDLQTCIAAIETARKKPAKNTSIKEFPEDDITIVNGMYGPYLKHAGSNYKIPSSVDATAMTREDCLKIISESEPTRKKGKTWKKKK
ncbi:MAG: type I DNA topoisomerase [Bacteroidales bacterium]|nr:type I DNA topoisomerase [Bacteroidales bacterium]